MIVIKRTSKGMAMKVIYDREDPGFDSAFEILKLKGLNPVEFMYMSSEAVDGHMRHTFKNIRTRQGIII